MQPQLSTGWSGWLWNGRGLREQRFSFTDSVERFTGLDFRITYGIMDGLEMGVFMTGDHQLLSLGIKKQLTENSGSGISVIAGFNYAAGNGIVSLRKRGLETHSSIPPGLAGTYKFGPGFSVDADVQVEAPLLKEAGLNKTAHYYFDVDAGYYPLPVLQLIAGLRLYRAPWLPADTEPGDDN